MSSACVASLDPVNCRCSAYRISRFKNASHCSDMLVCRRIRVQNFVILLILPTFPACAYVLLASAPSVSVRIALQAAWA